MQQILSLLAHSMPQAQTGTAPRPAPSPGSPQAHFEAMLLEAISTAYPGSEGEAQPTRAATPAASGRQGLSGLAQALDGITRTEIQTALGTAATPGQTLAWPSPAPAGAVHAPDGPEQAPTGPSQVPTGAGLTPTGPSQVPTGPSQVPTGPSQVPTGPSQVPTGAGLTPTGPDQAMAGPTPVFTEPGLVQPGPVTVPAKEDPAGAVPSTASGSADTEPEEFQTGQRAEFPRSWAAVTDAGTALSVLSGASADSSPAGLHRDTGNGPGQNQVPADVQGQAPADPSLAAAAAAGSLPGPASSAAVQQAPNPGEHRSGSELAGNTGDGPDAVATPSGLQLERFARTAAANLVREQAVANASKPETPESEPRGTEQPRHTFRELIDLIRAQEQNGSRAATPTRAPQAASMDAAGPPPVEVEPAPAGPVADLQAKPARVEAAPAQEAPALEPGRRGVDPEQVVRQVARFVRVVVEGTRSEVRMQLHPEHLGKVAVRLVINDGIVRAQLHAQDPAVRQVLEANIDQLRTRLADQGFVVEHLHLADGKDQSFGHPHHSGQREQQGQAPQQQRQFAWQGNLSHEEQEPGDSRHSAEQQNSGRTGQRLDHLA